MKSKILIAAIVGGACMLGLTQCSKARPISGVSSTVSKVIDGNTIELSNGLTVHILGVPATTPTENYLNTNVRGKLVTLEADRTSSKPKTYKHHDEHVWAYVKVQDGTNVKDVSGDMIHTRICDYTPDFVGDSAISYSATPDLPDPMPYPTLKAKMVPATFEVFAGNAADDWLGTGFFINERGLALTNNHVLNPSVNFAYISMPNAEGRIDGMRKRPVARILYTDPELDYTIFQVRLDEGETVPYLAVAKDQAQVPDNIAVVGNPLGLDAVFSEGHVSQIFNEAGKISVTADITHGNSGGPICNMRGLVVGIAQSVANSQGHGTAPKFGVDIMRVRPILDSHSDIPTYAGK